MNKYKYEIEYYFQPDKDTTPRVHWMYFAVEAKTVASSKTKAVDHYNKQVRDSGWTKYCTLNEIRPLQQPHDPPRKRAVVEEEPKPKTRRKPAARKTTTKKPTTRTKKK
tara:strand:+ start:47 stop:373 length:327 start_codon:yes stop_codon:yes gene_type:complete